MNLSLLIRAVGFTLAVVVGCLVCDVPAQAGETSPRIRAVLIWGTNDPKPDSPKLKDLDAKTHKRLRAVFKWKDYYEVNRKEFTASKKAGEKVRLSPKCEVAVQDLGGSNVEVRLYGEKRLVVTKRQVMRAGELLVLAGEDKNDTAWFVALTLAPTKR